MKKLLALVLAAACMLPMSMPALAKNADYTWSAVSAADLVDEDGKALGTGDTIRPGQTVYYTFGAYPRYEYLTDKDMVKVDVDKDVGSKYISSAKLVTTRLGNNRVVALEIVAKDNYSADEMKAKIDVYITAKKDLVAQSPYTGFPSFVTKPGTTRNASGRISATVEQLQKQLTDAENKKNLLGGGVSQKGSIAWITAQRDALTKWEEDKNATINSTSTTYKYSELEQKITDAKTAWDNAAKAAAENQAIIDTLGGTDATKVGTVAYYEAMRTAAKANFPSSPATITASVGSTDYVVNVLTTDALIADWTIASGGAATANDLVSTVSGLDAAVVTALDGNSAGSGTNYNSATIALNNGKTGQVGQTLQEKLTAATNAQTGLNNIRDTAQTTHTDWNNLNDGTFQAAKAASATARQAYATAAAAGTALTTATNDLAVLTGSGVGSITQLTSALETAAKAEGGVGFLNKNEVMKVPLTFWIENEKIEDDEDATFVAGDKGMVIKPVKNEENTVTWVDNNNTLAIVTFTADSSSDYFMPRLSTKWATNEDYDQYFQDTEAYVRSFVDNPYLPATSRARLWINNPFNDDDGESTIDPDDIYVYEVIDGELREIDAEFTQNDDDEDAFLIRTRRLGTYIFSDGPAEIEDEEEDYLPEDPPKIDIGNTSKPNPGTGI